MNLLSSLLKYTADQIAALRTSDSTASGRIDTVTGRVETAESNINTLDARITNLATLTDGSTTGDAELIDGRTGDNAFAYSNIGTAVRKQVAALKSDADKVADGLMPIRFTIINNSYPDAGGLMPYNGWSRTDYIEVTGGETLYFDNPSTASAYNALYDENKNYLARFNVAAGEKVPYTLRSDAKYLIASNVSATWYKGIYRKNARYVQIEDNLDTNTSDISVIQGTLGCESPLMEIGNYGFSDLSPIPTDSVYMADRRARNVSAMHLKAGDVISVGDDDTLMYFLAHYQTSAWVETDWQYADYTVATEADYYIIIAKIGNAAISSIDDLIKGLCIVRSGSHGYVRSQLASLSAAIKGIETGKNLPDYYYANNWWQDKLDDVRSASAIINGQTFAFVTDTHFNANAKNSKYLLKDIIDETTIPFVLCGGDVVGLYGSEDDLISDSYEAVEYQNYIGKDKFFTTRGNHDFYNSDNAAADKRWLTEKQAYDIFGRNCERFSIDMMPEHLCYVIENASQNTVILMINSKDGDKAIQSKITGAQAKWICDELLKYKDWNVIAVSHIPADPNIQWSEPTQLIVHTILSAFNNRGTVSTTHNGVAISADFSNASGEVWCHINGHTHTDDSYFSDNVLSIVTTCDAYYQDDGHGAVVGTITEQAFDVFCIDYDSETINAVRVGRGYSRAWAKVDNAWVQTV